MSCKCKKEIVRPDDGPKAIGPYSLGVITHGLLFTSGQLGLDPKTGELVKGGIEAETRQSIENITSILKAAGSSLDMVVKTTVYLKEITDFAPMNAVYAEYFHDSPPARTTLQAGGLPKNALVEIETIAIQPCDCDHADGGDDNKEECGCDCGCKE